MAWEQLKEEIAQTIKANGNQEITGTVLQQELYRMIDALGTPAEVFKIGTYLAAASEPIVLTAGVDNKISLPVSLVTDPVPNGFDIYVTPQGAALRFIGSGLGNGDSAIIRMDVMASLQADSGASDKVTFMAKTRPYTETVWENATMIPGFKVSRKMPNRDLGAIALTAPYFRINDGDLLEIAINPLTGITIIIDTFGFEAIQLLG